MFVIFITATLNSSLTVGAAFAEVASLARATRLESATQTETRVRFPLLVFGTRMRSDVNYHRIWNETNNRLDSLSARVRENRDVMAALDFARWLFWSGILELLEANACEGFHKVDGANLRWKCQELTRACQERFSRNDSKPHLEALQLQSIHEKLNLMAGFLSKLAMPAQVSVTSAAAPARVDLTVISGGLAPSVSEAQSSEEHLKVAL